MYTEAQITRMRALLKSAAPAVPPSLNRHFSLLATHSPIVTGPLRRRSMIKQVQLAARHYDLQGEVEAFVAAAGVASLAGLEIQHLEVLTAWIESHMDRLATACDSPDTPPAR